MSQSTATPYGHTQWEATAAELAGAQRNQHAMLLTLNAEHRHMATMLKLLNAQLDALEAGDEVEPHVLAAVDHRQRDRCRP